MFRCDVCGKKIDDISKYSNHMETCTGKLKCTTKLQKIWTLEVVD